VVSNNTQRKSRHVKRTIAHYTHTQVRTHTHTLNPSTHGTAEWEEQSVRKKQENTFLCFSLQWSAAVSDSCQINRDGLGEGLQGGG
jgi:hypothetical protein